MERVPRFSFRLDMPAPESIEDAIEQNALGPASVSVDGQTVVSKNIREQIEADNHLAGKEAAQKAHFGFRFTKLIPPGSG
jgi:hypothetical protein